MYRVSIHEAGHAVAAIAFGQTVDFIFIGRDEEFSNKAIGRVHRTGKSTTFNESIIKVSGYVAESLYQRKEVSVEGFSHPRYDSDREGMKYIARNLKRAEKLLRFNQEWLFALGTFLTDKANIGRRILPEEYLPLLGIHLENGDYVTNKGFGFYHRFWPERIAN